MKLAPLQQKKGQMELSLVIFIVIVVGLIIIAPFVLKAVNSFTTPFSSAIGNMSEEAGQSVTHVTDTFINFWDFVIMFAFLINLILLILSAFLIDTHPAWVIAYIIFAVFLLIFAPQISELLEKIYDNSELALETSQLAMVDFLREYLWVIMLGVYIISGVIIYGRIRSGGRTL